MATQTASVLNSTTNHTHRPASASKHSGHHVFAVSLPPVTVAFENPDPSGRQQILGFGPRKGSTLPKPSLTENPQKPKRRRVDACLPIPKYPPEGTATSCLSHWSPPLTQSLSCQDVPTSPPGPWQRDGPPRCLSPGQLVVLTARTQVGGQYLGTAAGIF